MGTKTKWEAARWYDTKASSYGEGDPLGIKRYEVALRNAPIADNMNVVDIGCKTGSLVGLIQKRSIQCNYHGLDISKVALDAIDSDSNFEFSLCDVTQGSPIQSNWADRVYCLEVIEHLREPMAAIEEIARILKDDGLAIISVPNPYYWGKILANILKLRDKEGHISAFTWIEMEALSRFGGLELIGTSKVVDVVPYVWKGVRRGKYVIVRALFSWQSQCTQFILRKQL